MKQVTAVVHVSGDGSCTYEVLDTETGEISRAIPNTPEERKQYREAFDASLDSP